MNPRKRRRGAWILLAMSLVGWPASAFTFAKDEPKAILGLSWFAITITAVDLLATTDVRDSQEPE